MKPASKKSLIIELIKLEALTKKRNSSQEVQSIQAEAMLEQLVAIPGDMALHALRQWIHQPDKSKAMWFPAWAELAELFYDAIEDRKLMIKACEK